MDKSQIGFQKIPLVAWEVPAAAQFIGTPPVLLYHFPSLAAWQAWGISLAISVLFYGWLSGAHVNPVVTLVMACGGKITFKQVPVYWICQAAGMVLGVFSASYLLTGSFSTAAAAELVALPSAETTPTWEIARAEAFGPLLFVLGVFVLASQPAIKAVSFLAIGAWLAVLAGSNLGSISGGSFNSTRAIVPYIMAGSTEDWVEYVIAYGLAPFVGVLPLCIFVFLVKGDEEAS